MFNKRQARAIEAGITHELPKVREDVQHSNDRPKIWVFWTARIGDRSQAEALARLTGWSYRAIKLDKSKPPESSGLTAPWPEMIISVDKFCTATALDLKRQSRQAIKVVKLGRPIRHWERLCNFLARRNGNVDLLVVPGHLHARAKPGVIRLDLPFSLVDPETLAGARGQFPEFAQLPAPRIAVLVGGAQGKLHWTPDVARKLGSDVSALARKLGGSLMITTSYRTGSASAAALMAAVEAPHTAYLWGQSIGPNPLLAYLAHADRVIVTMDSISMAADATKSGKPVMIYRLPPLNLTWVGSFFRYIHHWAGRDQLFGRLVDAGAVSWFNGADTPGGRSGRYLDHSAAVVQAVKRLVS